MPILKVNYASLTNPEMGRGKFYLIAESTGRKVNWPDSNFDSITFPRYGILTNNFIFSNLTFLSIKRAYWDFPGVAMDKTPHYQCRGSRFDPWSGN